MQLILNTETDIDIQRKMSTIEQESFDEKFINNTLVDKVDSEISNINDNNIKESVVEHVEENENSETNGNINKSDENNSIKVINEISDKDQVENRDDTKSLTECNQDSINIGSDVIIEEKESGEIKNVENVEVEDNGDKQINLQLKEDGNGDEKLNEEQQENGKKQENEEKQSTEQILDTDVHVHDNLINELDTSLQESNDDDLINIQNPIQKKIENNKEITADAVENGEVISILDEKEEESITMNDQEMTDVEKQSKTLLNTRNNISTVLLTDKEINNVEEVCIKKVNDPDIIIDSPSKENALDSNDENLLDQFIKKTKENLDVDQQTSMKEPIEKKTNINNNINKSKNLSLICKLSNTLDILSDEEEEPTEKESQNESSTVEKQCINIEDDDDIVLIDEETNVKDEKKNSENAIETKVENKECKEIPPVDLKVKETVEETMDINKDNKDSTNIKETEFIKEEEKSVESKPIQKPLLPVNFLKTCKKNLADMTRDELEEFCILKIVESVVDRSNLSEIKAQLKIMGQNIEEYKKKAMMLTKQNRDLQVVLKSVQEEQKKKSDVPITPLKITRSVGMQVFMTDKVTVRRKSSLIGNNSQNNLISNNPPNRLNKSQTNQSPKTQKNQINANNTQQIPVPRLVPASNTSNNKIQAPSSNIATKASVTANLPNGVRNSPPSQKPEKRPHSKIQQGNSVTVDLTEDEPPTKVLQRNVNPPVRLVSPQNLLAPQRQPFGANISSPRKVYIPISGSQNQVRPGQTIMLKPIAPSGPRQRLPSILPKTNSNTNTVRMTRINNRHPAPLPDSMKQYQPPNWKDLPPAPELKLSKVENGIVISWKIDGYQEEKHEEIASYQLYAYQETSSPPSTTLWKKIGDVKALPLPMACTLTQFMAGYKYYFAVRAVDIRSRLGPFSAPGSILLLNKM